MAAWVAELLVALVVAQHVVQVAVPQMAEQMTEPLFALLVAPQDEQMMIVLQVAALVVEHTKEPYAGPEVEPFVEPRA